eukprot:TRINITY_DN9974_c0_g1_i2.p1 TRINITY_DN9974_c0_g1~~TRINITY_DN9974_c0_g1_i2.p1  ORF type:complete len:144 (+),score=26.97 TRINITY_DN9974_c0_g1_i2:39-434(+)
MAPEVDFHLNYLMNSRYRESQRPMQLDIYAPTVGVAFEYQGQQHYAASPPRNPDVNSFDNPSSLLPTSTSPDPFDMFGDAKSRYERDDEKAKACEENGIRLIYVPYWWDRSETSLLATIRKIIPKWPQITR